MTSAAIGPWELLARAATPHQGLIDLARRVADDASATTLRIGALDADGLTLRWRATIGAASGEPTIYLAAGEPARLESYLRRNAATRASAAALPRPLLPIAGAAAGEVVIAALPRPGASHGVALLTVSGRTSAAAAARALATAAPALAVALARVSTPVDPAAAARSPGTIPPTGVTSGAGDRDGLSDKIIGADRGLRAVMQRVDQVSRSDVPVLILGETGSGKEVIARALHARSPRAGAAFLRVNCGAIPSELIDSELFGHERGAFTGAAAQRRGWFEQADGGSLFLDEIGELPLAAQVRLLRILQEGSFQRVGGERSITVDVRVIAATHRDLSQMIQAGRFREDLWYRLDVFPIRLPPLREHVDDIPAMAAHFASRAAARFGVAARAPTADDLRRLMAYDWPGNVRELGAVIDRAVLLGDGERLEVAKALGEAPVRERGPAERAARPTGAPDDGEIVTLDAAIRRHIEAALRRCHGRIEGPRGAARLLGVNPHTLRGRMRRLGVVWRGFRD